MLVKAVRIESYELQVKTPHSGTTRPEVFTVTSRWNGLIRLENKELGFVIAIDQSEQGDFISRLLGPSESPDLMLILGTTTLVERIVATRSS